MRSFTKEVIEQIEDIYNCNFYNDNKELIMVLFMQIFSYKFDDRISDEIKFKNIQEITSKVWIKEMPNKTNEIVGIPYIYDDKDKNVFIFRDQNGKTSFILKKIRNAIVHGDFIINEDGTITINDGNKFSMCFEFDCIVDICNIIASELTFNEENIKKLYNFLEFVKNMKNTPEDYNKLKIEHNFYTLKYPVILFNLLPMNEDDFHNNKEYSDFIIKLFSDKEYYKKGRLKDNTTLRVNELYKLRNCIVHGQYYTADYDLILFDHKDTFVFNCLRLDELLKNKNKHR